jgi:hypothetical protein
MYDFGNGPEMGVWEATKTGNAFTSPQGPQRTADFNFAFHQIKVPENETLNDAMHLKDLLDLVSTENNDLIRLEEHDNNIQSVLDEISDRDTEELNTWIGPNNIEMGQLRHEIGELNRDYKLYKGYADKLISGRTEPPSSDQWSSSGDVLLLPNRLPLERAVRVAQIQIVHILQASTQEGPENHLGALQQSVRALRVAVKNYIHAVTNAFNTTIDNQDNSEGLEEIANSL